jgi:hypothetical protein
MSIEVRGVSEASIGLGRLVSLMVRKVAKSVSRDESRSE